MAICYTICFCVISSMVSVALSFNFYNDQINEPEYAKYEPWIPEETEFASLSFRFKTNEKFNGGSVLLW